MRAIKLPGALVFVDPVAIEFDVISETHDCVGIMLRENRLGDPLLGVNVPILKLLDLENLRFYFSARLPARSIVAAELGNNGAK